jgi:hypothetical protein
MTKDHFIPRFIIRNFTDSNENIRFYNKETRLVSPEINHYTQLQKWNFHSKKSLIELKNLFPDIEINSIFNKSINEDLETALNHCLESSMSVIVAKIVQKFNNREKIILTEEENYLVKEYVVIQHLRTLKFKMISKEFNEKFSLPPDFKDKIIEMENNREINIKAIIKKRGSQLNHQARRELEMKWRKKLKKNPKFVEEIRQILFNESLDGMVKDAEVEIKEILTHPERHSAQIINKKQRDSFFRICGLDKKGVKIIINLTDIPFVLGDTGILMMADDFIGKNNLEIFLPIHPNLVIGLSENLPENAVIDDTFVANFNRISKEESYKNVYSASETTLNTLK